MPFASAPASINQAKNRKKAEKQTTSYIAKTNSYISVTQNNDRQEVASI